MNSFSIRTVSDILCLIDILLYAVPWLKTKSYTTHMDLSTSIFYIIVFRDVAYIIPNPTLISPLFLLLLHYSLLYCYITMLRERSCRSTLRLIMSLYILFFFRLTHLVYGLSINNVCSKHLWRIFSSVLSKAFCCFRLTRLSDYLCIWKQYPFPHSVDNAFSKLTEKYYNIVFAVKFNIYIYVNVCTYKEKKQ